jgi:hypothetical protein
MRRALALASALCLALTGCGGSSTAPTAPAPTPTPAPVVSFAGAYSGSYTLTSCGHTLGMAAGDFCGTFSIGTVLPMTLNLTQSGAAVTGTLLQGQIATSVSGTVDSRSHLILNGSGTSSGFVLTMAGWDTQLSGTLMIGSWNTVWTLAGTTGMAQTVNTLGPVVKTSSAGVASSSRALKPGATIHDLFDALRH